MIARSDGASLRGGFSTMSLIRNTPGLISSASMIPYALTSSRGGDLHAVAPRLMAYARSLDLDAQWSLAADVYETVIAHAHPVEDSDVAVNALLRRAHLVRPRLIRRSRPPPLSLDRRLSLSAVQSPSKPGVVVTTALLPCVSRSGSTGVYRIALRPSPAATQISMR